MKGSIVDREAAFRLLCTYTASDSLIKHGLGVEAALRGYADRYGEDRELWGITGLLHDFDYERWPDPQLHTVEGERILREEGYPEAVIHAIRAHAPGGPPRTTLLDKALFACDELVGFVTAVALVRPSRSLREVSVSSVRKKWKDKTFARGVSREDILQGARELELELEEHIGFVIAALLPVAPALGLGEA